MRWLTLLLLLATPALAVTIVHDGVSYDCDPTYSFRDFTGHNLSLKGDMDGKTICRSCFSNETPEAEVLPPMLTGATFVESNLANVHIPDGNTVVGCNTIRFKVQTDGMNWRIGKLGQPLEPLDPEAYAALGLGTDPADLPEEPIVGTTILEMRRQQIDNAVTAASEAAGTMARTDMLGQPPPTINPNPPGNAVVK